MIYRFIGGCRAIWGWLTAACGWLSRAFVSTRFAKIVSEFLTEVGVLVFVFPTLDTLIKGDTGRLHVMLPWSLVVTTLCLIGAAILSMIGDVP